MADGDAGTSCCACRRRASAGGEEARGSSLHRRHRNPVRRCAGGVSGGCRGRGSGVGGTGSGSGAAAMADTGQWAERRTSSCWGRACPAADRFGIAGVATRWWWDPRRADVDRACGGTTTIITFAGRTRGSAVRRRPAGSAGSRTSAHESAASRGWRDARRADVAGPRAATAAATAAGREQDPRRGSASTAATLR